MDIKGLSWFFQSAKKALWRAPGEAFAADARRPPNEKREPPKGRLPRTRQGWSPYQTKPTEGVKTKYQALPMRLGWSENIQPVVISAPKEK